MFTCLVTSGACSYQDHQPGELLLATTTSTENSGLLATLLPDFEDLFRTTVNIVAVGSGQALAHGEAGDADVLLVHAPALEKRFLAAGHGTARFKVMYNDFVIIGPTSDPAGIRGYVRAVDALIVVSDSESSWASRGDESGTHVKEMSLWAASGINPKVTGDWYNALGQGMSATLHFANETDSYTLSDRGTYLTNSEHLPYLTVLVGGASIDRNPDPSLYNYYSVIPVNPEKGSNVKYDLALQFVSWLTSPETQERIGHFGVEEFGQPLFHPIAVR